MTNEGLNRGDIVTSVTSGDRYLVVSPNDFNVQTNTFIACVITDSTSKKNGFIRELDNGFVELSNISTVPMAGKWEKLGDIKSEKVEDYLARIKAIFT